MPAGTITTGSHPKALWPGVHAFWGQIFNEHPPEYPDLFDIEESSMAYEEDVQITGFGLGQVKPEGAPIAFDSEIQGPVTRYVHIAYALGYIVTYEELRDNLYEVVSMRRAKANAFSMVQTIENVAAGFYNRAFNPLYTLADGQPVISTAHPFTTGGSFSNALSPASDLNEAALEDICIQIMGFQTDRGLLVNFMPMSLHVPRQEWYNANRHHKQGNQGQHEAGYDGMQGYHPYPNRQRNKNKKQAELIAFADSKIDRAYECGNKRKCA